MTTMTTQYVLRTDPEGTRVVSYWNEKYAHAECQERNAAAERLGLSVRYAVCAEYTDERPGQGLRT